MFSVFIPGVLDPAIAAALPAADSTSFNPPQDSWGMDNFGHYFSDGQCFGMSAYAWWFSTHRAEPLFTKYSTTSIGLPGQPSSIAHITALRAHLAVSVYWNRMHNNVKAEWKLSESKMAKWLKYHVTQDEPVVLYLVYFDDPNKDDDKTAAHAVLVIGYDAAGFILYDPNFKGVTKHLNYSNANGFADYTQGTPAGQGYDHFAFFTGPSLGRNSDFAELTAEAEAGFLSSSEISLSAPDGAAPLSNRNAIIMGELTGSLSPESSLLCYCNGMRFNVDVNAGDFSGTIPLHVGQNLLVLLAGNTETNLSRWHKNSAALIREVECTGTGYSDLTVMLSWDVGNVDLYVTDPEGQTTWRGGTYYGGPSFYTGEPFTNFEMVQVGGNVASPPKLGEYNILVHYKALPGDPPVRGMVQIVKHENEAAGTRQSIGFSISEGGLDNDEPGSTGPGWKYIATVQAIELY